MPALSRLLASRKLWLVVGVTVVVAALVSLVVLRPWAAERDAADVAPPGPGDRVLQSVDVAMQSDGALSQIGDTVVISRAQTGQADTKSGSHDPSKVVDDLPVRVLPSYRTASSSGTNLADLKGYTGRVSIDLTVQNLTVRPQQVSYDAGGQSRSATAMVGAPLTVVASASLPGVDPASVVAQPQDATTDDPDATNGVLSRSPDQVTQVQWATILAPPQLSATATLRLVLNAKDFAVPTIDINVQPGLVTDPSVGALVDAAFNPKNSDKLALQTRTIAVIGDVNDVLNRAGGQISKVRKTLDSTSKTLGAKTVVELQRNTKQIDTSLKQSDQNLGALDEALQSSPKSTSSSTLQKLEATVGQIKGLLGDTTAAPPRVTVSGTGCAAKVAAPTSGGTVYASLLEVTAQLEAYATTTEQCRDELRKTIADTIGPETPDADTCRGDAATSVTCAIDAVRTVSGDIKSAQSASAQLDPDSDFEASRAGVDALIEQLTALVDATAKDPDDSDLSKKLAETKTAIANADRSLTEVTSAIGDIHDAAVSNERDANSMVAQNTTFADSLCQVIGDGTQPGRLTAEQVEAFRSHLVTQSCPDANGARKPLSPPQGVVPMETRLQKQSVEWSDVAAQTDTTNTDAGLGKSLAAASGALSDAGDALADGVAGVNSAADQALDDLKVLDGNLATLRDQYKASKVRLDAALAAAATNADAEAGDLQQAIKQVFDDGQKSSDELGTAFTNSAAGLRSAAQTLQDNGTGAIDQQRAELDKTQQDASSSLSAAMTGSLDQISGDVGSATRDLRTTRTQLTRDLANILLDLGNPSVNGSGVIGTLAKGATAAGSADYQLGLAGDQTSAYAAVRAQDVAGILLRQAQAEAALARQAELPAFATEFPDGVQHRTVYTFHLSDR